MYTANLLEKVYCVYGTCTIFEMCTHSFSTCYRLCRILCSTKTFFFLFPITEDDDDGCYDDDDEVEDRGHGVDDEEDAAVIKEPTAKPLVQIQSYLDRGSSQQQQQQQKPVGKFQQQSKINSNNNIKKASHQQQGGDKKEALGRKSSFHEIQNKFKSMERRQKEEEEEERKAKVVAGVVERRHFQQKLEKALKKKDEEVVNNVETRRSREDVIKPVVDESTSRMLESYLIRSRQRSAGESPASNKRISSSNAAPRSQSRVRRQTSNVSSSNNAVSGGNNYHRNMEAVGEFEKVWSWATEHATPDVMPTRELSPEYKPRERAMSPSINGGGGGGNRRQGVLSPVEQRRSRRPAVEQSGYRRDRGLSSPAEMRRISPSRQSGDSRGRRPVHHHPPAFFSSIPQSPMLSQHHLQQQQQQRRAASPEMGRRADSRPILRREKTAVFDNRYPSLDLRNERRKTLYEMQEEAAARMADLRRRSYHELSNPELLHPAGPPGVGVGVGVPPPLHHHPMVNPHNFQHSGKKSKDSKNKNLGMMPPPPPMHHPWAGYPPPMGPPSMHGPPGGGRLPAHMGPPRFGMPMRPY